MLRGCPIIYYMTMSFLAEFPSSSQEKEHARVVHERDQLLYQRVGNLKKPERV